MANVVLRNVRKTYAGGFEAIKGIDFEIGDGQFCVLVGPSGCGKSTLLRMVAGLETITSGEIDIGGRIVNQIEPADARHRHGVPELRALSAYERLQQHGLRPAQPPHAGARDRHARAGSRAHSRTRRDARPQAAAAVRRPAPARRDGPRHRAAAEGVPVRRAAVEPRRQAAHRHARRDPQTAAPIDDHLDLRHPRPARGDDAGRYSRGDERRPGRADRQSARHLPEARDHLRRLLHRRAADESDAAAIGRIELQFAGDSRAPARPTSSASAPRISSFRAKPSPAASRSTSRSKRSSGSAPRPSSTAPASRKFRALPPIPGNCRRAR